MDLSTILLFIPTFFFISLTPGMCMTLALTLGLTIGIRKTFYMMYGELLGVAIVAISAVLGVATIMLTFPALFTFLKIIGALYLCYIAFQMWHSKGKLNINSHQQTHGAMSKATLFKQGLVTAIANPKGWAFMISMLPPFINKSYALPLQLFVLVAIILMLELSCMIIYATGGKSLAVLLNKPEHVKTLNRVSATLMLLIAIWLVTT